MDVLGFAVNADIGDPKGLANDAAWAGQRLDYPERVRYAGTMVERSTRSFMPIRIRPPEDGRELAYGGNGEVKTGFVG